MKFIDISNYLAPGFSYSQFLKAYGCSIEKGYFPYEWFDSYDKLNYPHFPSKEAFYSKLQECNPLQNDCDYNRVEDIWVQLKMSTFKDYLQY